MALTGEFLRTVWAGTFLQALYANTVYAGLGNRNYEVDSQNARTVKIPKITGTTNVRDYTKDTDIMALDLLDDSTVDLVLDQAKYFGFYVDDLDQAQSNLDIVAEYTRQYGVKIRSVIDQYVANLISVGVKSANIKEVTTAKASVTDGYVSDLLELKEIIRSANIPSDRQLNMVVNPQFMNILENYLVVQGSTSEVFIPAAADDTLRNGFRGRLLGFNLHETTVIPTGTAGTTTNIKASRANLLVTTSDAFTFAQQVENMEPFRPEKRFGDAVKGLYVYAGKITDDDQMFMLQINTG